MRLMTLMSVEAIDCVVAKGGGGVQKELAFRVVELVRGKQSAEEAKKESEALFGGSGETTNSVIMTREKMSSLTLVELMLETSLAPSKVCL
jgi:tyrosyl-tRNA synthetase